MTTSRPSPQQKSILVCMLLAAVAVAIAPCPALASCYQLSDGKNELVLQSSTPPIDLSRSISEELGSKFPEYHFVSSNQNQCQEIDEIRRRANVSKLPDKPLNRGPIVVGAEQQDTYASNSLPRAFSSSAPSRFPTSAGRTPPVAGTDIHVRAHTRKDGTHVPAHTRSRPKR